MNDAQQDSVIAVGQRVKQALAGFREIEQIVLFGSVSRGTARAASDIDVALDAGKPLTQGQRVAMIEALALELGRPVDLVDLKAAGQPLLSQIVTTGKRLSGSDTAWAKIIYRNIIDNEDFVPLQRRVLQARQQAWINR
ncbi:MULTISPECIES: type VII toxin-antitoxin system MntA family adenylyltransferase antitoxin [Halomonadaceae]|uniref:Nucleotidyltransferase domain-containing protein n=1 Tax=Modicisalibacter zincidurans TaxID=1178777 RepID=A0ABP9RJV0_9GAMM|nr:nucleotidyltransferase domain-containing protein [Halomonas zincidurans]MCD6008718.1 nucleotidyltransferase domain-containing protein [Halomonas sp. IOP_31]